MLKPKHRLMLAVVLTVLVVGWAASSLAAWEVAPFVNTEANEYFAAWSPDAEQMAYVSDATGMRQIYIVNADGTGTWQVTDDANGVYDVVWSPDSQYLLYTQAWAAPKDVVKVELNETRDAVVATTNLTNDAQTATWQNARFSPDGTMIVANRIYGSACYVYTIAPDGSGVTRVTNSYATYPTWTPDGTQITYALGANYSGITHIYALAADLSSNVELVNWASTNLQIRAFAYSPDGSKFVFSKPLEPVSFLAVVNADGTGLLQLDGVTSACAHQLYAGQEDVWSADGSKIVYISQDDSIWNIYTIKPDGTDKELVVASDTGKVRARYFGNGNIVYETVVDGNWDIYVATSNHPPTADTGGPYIVPATSWDGALVELDGSASSDPDGDALSYSWKIGDEEIGTDPVLVYEFPIGLTEDVTLTVTDPSGASDTAATTVTVTVIDVQIDIRPLTDFNFINLNSNGVLPVVFFTDEVIDAASIDPVSITMAGHDFGGLIKMRGRRNPQPAAWLLDVDQDGDDDLLVLLEIENLTLEPTDTICVLGALTYDGLVVQGQDNVIIWPGF
jgi:Tol biopolymer transport system component